MINASLGAKNDQYNNKESKNIKESNGEDIPLRTVIQEIEITYILLLTPLWKEVL